MWVLRMPTCALLQCRSSELPLGYYSPRKQAHFWAEASSLASSRWMPQERIQPGKRSLSGTLALSCDEELVSGNRNWRHVLL